MLNEGSGRKGENEKGRGVPVALAAAVHFCSADSCPQPLCLPPSLMRLCRDLGDGENT